MGKAKKNKYLYVIAQTGSGAKPSKESFDSRDDRSALMRFFERIHKLSIGQTVAMYRWDSCEREWVFMKRGGKDAPQKSVKLVNVQKLSQKEFTHLTRFAEDTKAQPPHF